MKKTFRSYLAIWAVFLVVYNLICFITPNEMFGYVKIDKTFWVAYSFVTVSFVGQLICAFIAFKETNLNKFFYSIPLITISYAGLIAMLVVGSVIMMIPNLPTWIAAVVCILIFAFTLTAVIKASAAADLVKNIDAKIDNKTSFIRNLTADAESLMSKAKSDVVKEYCKKVYEAIRYSDPMSNEALSVVEAKITVKVDEIASAVGADDTEKAKEIADEILILVGDRNKKCKELK